MRARTAVVAGLMLACASGAQAATPCSSGQVPVPARTVSALPIGDVSFDSVAPVAAQGDRPAYCQVVGRIAPVDPAGFPIRFQVNMPDAWNGKTLQIGGGGTNGVLVTGLETPRIASGSVPPLARGFVTYGTDAGHTRTAPDPQSYAVNAEAVRNQAYAAYKKTRDVVLAIVVRHYGRRPTHAFFFGNSEGGREALMMAQRFPRDYDGIIATVPAMNWTGQHLAHHNQWIMQRDGGWLSPAKVALLTRTSLAACDALDGIADGVIGFQASCAQRIDLVRLRCIGGADTGNECLSDHQLAFARSIYEPYRFAFPIADGVTAYPPSPFGGESAAGGIAGSLMVTTPPKPGDLGRPLAGPGSVRYFFARDPGFARAFDMTAYRARVLELSRLFDPTDPNLAPFARHGRLIVVDYGADYVKSPYGSADYYQSVVRRLGQRATDRFARYYMLPGLAHSGDGKLADGSGVPNRLDIVSLLDRWVTKGIAPAEDAIVVARSTDGAVRAARPLCRYPATPVYRGAGDPSQAAAYRCAVDPAHR